MDAGIIVAHPDDEILWAGGVLLQNPRWNCHIYTLCRASDPDRSPKFYKVLALLNAKGKMADMNDGPEQYPLQFNQVEDTILDLMDGKSFDIILTHGPLGEYTYHLRHVEVSKAVIKLWEENKIQTKELWLFAYEDKNGTQLPGAIENAHLKISLPEKIWQKKKEFIQKVYGFSPDSWEARVTPRIEAFWNFNSIDQFKKWNYKE